MQLTYYINNCIIYSILNKIIFQNHHIYNLYLYSDYISHKFDEILIYYLAYHVTLSNHHNRLMPKPVPTSLKEYCICSLMMIVRKPSPSRCSICKPLNIPFQLMIKCKHTQTPRRTYNQSNSIHNVPFHYIFTIIPLVHYSYVATDCYYYDDYYGWSCL